MKPKVGYQCNLNLPEVDRVSITLIVDNSVDLLLASSDVAKRFKLGSNPFEGYHRMRTRWYH